MTTLTVPLTTRQQYALLRRVIRWDAEITGVLCNEKGQMCVVGGLLHYGFKVPKNKLFGRIQSITDKTGAWCKVQDFLPSRLSVLTPERVDELMHINDRHDGRSDRQAALLRLVKGWELAEQT